MTLVLLRSSGTFSRPSFYLRASLTVWHRCETQGLRTQEERHSAVMRAWWCTLRLPLPQAFRRLSVNGTNEEGKSWRQARSAWVVWWERINPNKPQKGDRQRLETRLTSPALLSIVLPRGACSQALHLWRVKRDSPRWRACSQAIPKATLYVLILFFRVTQENFNFFSSVLQNTSFQPRGSSDHQGAVILLTNVLFPRQLSLDTFVSVQFAHVMEILRKSGTRMLFTSKIWDSFETDCYTGYFPFHDGSIGFGG